MRLLSFLLPLLAAACNAPETDEIPWKDSTFLTGVPTTITYVNESDSIQSLRSDLRNYPTDLRDVLPDSLRAGEQVTVQTEIARPYRLFVGIGGRQSLRTVLPGYSRTLTYTQQSMRETGEEQSVYNYLDSALMPLYPMPFYPLKLRMSHNIMIHYLTVSTAASTPYPTGRIFPTGYRR